MFSLARIFSILALLVTAIAAYFAYDLVQRYHQCIDNAYEASQDLGLRQKTFQARSNDLTKAQEGLSVSQAALTKAKTDLAESETDLHAAENRQTELGSALQASEDRIAQLQKKIGDLTKLWEGSDPVELKQKAASLTDSITAAKAKNQDLQQKGTEASKVVIDLQDSLIIAHTPAKALGIHGRVVTLNRTWNFAVLNIGSEDGLSQNATLLVYRNSQLIGKLRVSSVERKIAIGDVIPESTPASLQPGDEVMQ